MGIINFLRKSIEYTDKNSLAYKCRIERMRIFTEYFESKFAEQLKCRGGGTDGSYDKKIRILDVGGTISYWLTLDFKYLDACHITLLNLEKVAVPDEYKNIFTAVSGDASNMHEYEDNAFDLVFSNSVIEHLGDYDKQVLMISEMKRLGLQRYIQTPNRYFPVEPHFKFPLFQFFPMKLKIWLVSHYNLHHHKAYDYCDACSLVLEIRLLNLKELQDLLPGVYIHKEKLGIFTKSYYAFF